jgi:hypothetical protein
MNFTRHSKVTKSGEVTKKGEITKSGEVIKSDEVTKDSTIRKFEITKYTTFGAYLQQIDNFCLSILPDVVKLQKVVKLQIMVKLQKVVKLPKVDQLENSGLPNPPLLVHFFRKCTTFSY